MGDNDLNESIEYKTTWIRFDNHLIVALALIKISVINLVMIVNKVQSIQNCIPKTSNAG